MDRGILLPVIIDKVRVPLQFRRKQAATLLGFPGRRDVGELNRLMIACARLCKDGRRISKLQVPMTERVRAWALPVVTASALVLAFIFGTLFLTGRSETAAGDPGLPIASIYVAPFEVSTGTEDPSGEIAASLTRIRNLHVTRDDPGIVLPFADPVARQTYTLTGTFDGTSLTLALGAMVTGRSSTPFAPARSRELSAPLLRTLQKTWGFGCQASDPTLRFPAPHGRPI